jgi:hypothetical protein
VKNQQEVLGKTPGDITLLTLEECCYHPNADKIVIGIEMSEIEYHFGLSPTL